ncbi:MAG: hypothetical protein IPL35_09350 [Sphingobacteriales bacterium]|nr:hypothetical protein [Sphingobacteriales bacterium]
MLRFLQFYSDSVEAGILLAATYICSHGVCGCRQGLHFAWNYVQSAVFGLAVSGNDLEGWIVPQVSGNEWITGGSFGPECSIFALILCTSAGIYFLYRAYQRGQWISPNWRLLPRALPSS